MLRRKRALPKLISVGPRERLRRAIELMHIYNISQLPVMDGARSVGSLNESSVMKLLFDGSDFNNQEVQAVMGRPLPEIAATADIAEAYRLFLAGAGAAIVIENGIGVGVITRSDIIERMITRRGAAGWEIEHEI